MSNESWDDVNNAGEMLVVGIGAGVVLFLSLGGIINIIGGLGCVI